MHLDKEIFANSGDDADNFIPLLSRLDDVNTLSCTNFSALHLQPSPKP